MQKRISVCQTFTFLEPGCLIDGDLELVLMEKGRKGPPGDLFPFYKFQMVNAVSRNRMGQITIRIGDPHGILRYPCHIGFGVDEAYRGNQYAVRATRLLAGLAERHGMKAIWIGCSEENTASRICCERLGAELVETIEVPEGIDLHDQGIRKLCRYRMTIKDREYTNG